MMEERVCCMCGDVGFSDKLFRCGQCHNRFQHSYCSSYYSELEPSETCEWCRKVMSRHGGSSAKKECPSAEIKHSKSGAGGGASVASPKTATRRYKLLKDVMS